MRLQDRPVHRAQRSVRSSGADVFLRGAEAVLAFESADHSVESKLARALSPRHARVSRRALGDVRDGLHLGPFRSLPRGRDAAASDAVRRVCGAGPVTCRFAHACPDGPAPYYTVLAPARRGSELAQWAEIEHAAMEAIGRFGGTVKHHHAVGRDHRSQRTMGSMRRWSSRLCSTICVIVIRATATAVKIEIAIPSPMVTANPRAGPDPTRKSSVAASSVVRLESTMVT